MSSFTRHLASIPDLRSEKQIQNAGVKVLKALGFSVYNLSQSRASRQTSGLADSFVIGHGVTAWIEWKTATGKPSIPQVRFGYGVKTNNGHYVICRNEADVIAWAEPIVNNDRMTPRPASTGSPAASHPRTR